MISYSPRLRVLACCYAALAGFVDALGFLKSGGLFVSFMTGNSTRLAVGVAEMTSAALAAAALIVLFVLGVTLGALVGSHRSGMARKRAAALIVSAFLFGAAIAEPLGWSLVVIGSLCVAMGAANTIFQRDGDVSIGVTYMTGTLVRLGFRLAAALQGRSRSDWIGYLILWLALVIGGIAGAAAYLWSASGSLWLATLLSLGLVAAMTRPSANRAGQP